MEIYKCKNCGKEFKKEYQCIAHETHCIPEKEITQRNKKKNKQELVHITNGYYVSPINLDKNMQVNGKKILFHKNEMIEVIERSCGSVNWIAKAYGVSSNTIHKYLNENPELKDLLEKQQYVVVTKAADNIYEGVMKGDIELSKWLLTHLPTKFRDKLEIKNDIKIEIVTNNKNIDKL